MTQLVGIVILVALTFHAGHLLFAKGPRNSVKKHIYFWICSFLLLVYVANVIMGTA
jgi:hypothetical protein